MFRTAALEDYATFRDTCVFKLVTPQAGDIDSAFYQLVSADGKGNETRGAATFSDSRPATVGPCNSLRAGTRFSSTRRIALETKVSGQSSRLLGFGWRYTSSSGSARPLEESTSRSRAPLNVEGSVVPEIHFLVNDSYVVDRQDLHGKLTPESPSFRTTLTLPRFRNKIEVRYEWGGEIFPFSPPAIIPDVEVGAPEIVLLPEPLSRTKEDKVNLVGIVRPYFPGLKLSLSHKKVGQWSLNLRPDQGNGPDAAEFRRDVYLSPNALNEFEFVPEYDGEVLASNLPPFSIYCDTTPPELEDINFKSMGLHLHVRMTPSESLSLLRIREADHDNWFTELVIPTTGEYLHITRLPSGPTTFTVEMTDRVGNVNEMTKKCQMFDISNVAEATPAVFDDSDDEDVPKSRDESDEILKSLGITFKEYGKDGESMMTTELPERTWETRNLREEGIRPEVEEGSLQMPAVVSASFEGAQLIGLVTWLSEKVNDGFEYYVPSPEQWARFVHELAGSEERRSGYRELVPGQASDVAIRSLSRCQLR